MNYIVLFPEAENVHLTKDVGMIPYILHKYYSYNSTVVCYKNEEQYKYLEDEVRGLKVDFIKAYTGKAIFDSSIYLMKNAKKIDILQLFHFTKRNFLWVIIYKLLNPHGKIYIKLDANESIQKYTFQNNIRDFIKLKILKKCNLISVETKRLYEVLNKKWPIRIEYIPNGFYSNCKKAIKYENKENIICTVGRIGATEKATEILLEAYKLAFNKITNWKLRIIGPIEKEFERYIENYFKDSPNLKDNIEFIGPLYDKERLQEEYDKVKIFCLTSRYESFGIVLVEALRAGCFVITSDIISAKDITNDGKLGEIFNIDDYTQLSAQLEKYCNNEEYLGQLCSEIQEYAYENFDWIKICETIVGHLSK